MSTKDWYRRSWVFLGQAGYFFGWDGDSFPFYSGPMLSYVPKAKGCRQKDSKLGIFVVSTELGIFGAAGYFRVGWRKIIL